MSDDIRAVTVLGTGVLGSQIALQTAVHGFDVTAYDISDDALSEARERLRRLADTYEEEAPFAQGKTQDALQGITLTSDLAEAVSHADLVIEAVPERMEIKKDVYAELSRVAPERTIFVTNSSTLLPSELAEVTGRPDRFLALHFANRIWTFNTAEVMGHEGTDPEVFDTVVAFAEAIRMVPIPMAKEKAGYVINSLLVPLYEAAGELAALGYASPEDVDRVWRIGTGAPLGPFEIYDIVGLGTIDNILSNGDDTAQQVSAWLRKNYIDRGRMGRSTGAGIYEYDD